MWPGFGHQLLGQLLKPNNHRHKLAFTSWNWGKVCMDFTHLNSESSLH